MEKQLMDDMSFKKIISNQDLIIQDLDKSYNSMCLVMQLSDKYLPQAINNFNIGQQHIAKIRHNLDTIHKIITKINKKIHQEKLQIIQQQKLQQNLKPQIPSDQIFTVTQAINQMINQETKDNFQAPSPTLIEIQARNIANETKIENELEKNQVDKLLAYYKLDDQEDETSALKSLQKMSPTTIKFEQAFTIIKSLKNCSEKPEKTPIDEPLI